MAQQTEREKEQQFKYYWYAARHAQDLEKYDQALALYQICEMINSKDAKTKETIGLIYYQADEKEKAEKYLREAFELDPGYCWRSYYVFMLYRWAKDLSQTAEKLAVLKPASEANPKDSRIWEELASVYLGGSEWEKAFAAMDSMEAIGGQEPRCAKTRARVYIYENKFKKALEALDNYLNVNADEEELLEMRLQVQEKLKINAKEKIQTCQRILALNPDNVHALNNYACYLSELKQNLDLAEQMASRAVTIESTNPGYLDTYAWVLYLRGKTTLAKFYIKRAKDNCPYYMKEELKAVEKHYKQIYR